jgi:hypothetical protein
MTRLRLALLTLLLMLPVLAVLPRSARAGGTEFPADGTRGLGRGGARAARADDPTIMTRNPAALALLWDDQAIIGAHLLLVDACMRPTGGYGWGLQSMGRTAFDLGEGPVYPFAQEGDTNLDGTPLVGFAEEAYPEVCYEGNAPFLPHLALSNKISDDLGVGIGFFPPDSSSLFQWGNRDGTVDTPNGLRPNPLRYLRSAQNVSYFSVLGAAGYRIAPWISVGVGLQWMLVIYEATTWTTPTSGLDPESDVRGDLFGRDLFVPGVIASVHLQPFDFLDVVVGAKWSDRVKSKVKLDRRQLDPDHHAQRARRRRLAAGLGASADARPALCRSPEAEAADDEGRSTRRCRRGRRLDAERALRRRARRHLLRDVGL